MNDDRSAEALAKLRDEADRFVSSIPDVPTAELLERARSIARPRFSTWTRAAIGAAATIAAAVGLLLVDPAPRNPVEPPATLSSLVDSLYAEDDYIVDQVDPLIAGSDSGDYLSDVWGDVVSHLRTRRD